LHALNAQKMRFRAACRRPQGAVKPSQKGRVSTPAATGGTRYNPSIGVKYFFEIQLEI
jgi:hypothetical protein